jgi:hypothetical protein
MNPFWQELWSDKASLRCDQVVVYDLYTKVGPFVHRTLRQIFTCGFEDPDCRLRQGDRSTIVCTVRVG